MSAAAVGVVVPTYALFFLLLAPLFAGTATFSNVNFFIFFLPLKINSLLANPAQGSKSPVILKAFIFPQALVITQGLTSVNVGQPQIVASVLPRSIGQPQVQVDTGHQASANPSVITITRTPLLNSLHKKTILDDQNHTQNWRYADFYYRILLIYFYFYLSSMHSHSLTFESDGAGFNWYQNHKKIMLLLIIIHIC